ncbi:response regulator transcription factor [Lacibacterium aquatile]|uniref:Response regulator transcription factor n=1 Tax=Lacibacterium aquatile TaxID=1168082 RepID=A0ABW5DW77_9PROT
MARLALVEADLAIATVLADALRAAGHEVLHAPDERTDMLITSLSRAVTPDGPPTLLILSAGELCPPDAAAALEKPVRIPALLEAVQKLLAKAERLPRNLGIFQFAPALRVLSHPDGRSVRLTETETRLLDRLAAAGSEGLSRESLLTEVWGWRPDLETHTVETHLYRLRRKLKACDGEGLIDRSGPTVKLVF